MALTEFTDDVSVIGKLSTFPNADDGLTPEQLKAKFDEAPEAIKKYLNDQVVPAVQGLQKKAGTFRVVVSGESTEELVADKTHAEIYAAHEAGQAVECVLSTGEVLPLVFADPETAIFQSANGAYYSRIVIKADDTVTYNSGNYALRSDIGDVAVHVTKTGDGYTSDHPEDIILNIYRGGKAIVCVLSDGTAGGVIRLPLKRIDESGAGTGAVFSGVYNGEVYTVTITGASVSVEMSAVGGGGVSDSDYYTSLSEAIADINNETNENATQNLSDAKVRVFTGDYGVTTVMLLSDVSEDLTIDINKDINLVLGDSTIALSSGARLNFNEGTKCSVSANQNGGITKNVEAESSDGLYLAVVSGESLTVNGGFYSLNGKSVVGCIAFATTSSCKTIKLDRCDLYAENVSTPATGDHVARCIQNQAAELAVSKCTMTASAQGPAQCIMGIGEISVDKSVATARSSYSYVKAIFAISGNSNISDTIINATTYSSDSYADGIYNDINSVLKVRNSKILADAQGVNITTGSRSIACLNLGIAYFENVEFNGTHSGVQNNGKLYVSGGTYTGYCHGGFYLAHGTEGVAYINDANIRSGNYEGEFDYSEMTGYIYGAMYIGGGGEENNSNMNVYVDGCTFDSAGHHICIVMRGTTDEQNNTLNISNSTLGDGGRVRVDNDTHTLNVGIGTDITADMIVDKDGVKHGDWVTFTDCLYRKSDEATVCKGADLNTLTEYVDVKSQSGGSGIPVPDTASVGQTIVVKAVDENGKPTEWEPATLNGQPELIRTVTIPADIATDESGVSWGQSTADTTKPWKFTFDTDQNGEPFRLKSLVCIHKGSAAGATTASAFAQFSATGGAYFGGMGVSTASNRAGILIWDGVLIIGNNTAVQTHQYPALNVNRLTDLKPLDVATVSEIMFYFNNSTHYWPEGDTFDFYGVRA